MDHSTFASFLARRRKELGLTQKELADRLHVTDKAISKWETGKGFPDIKLLEPLAQALDVTLVELIQGEQQERDSVTMDEAGVILTQAMDRSQKAAALGYLRLLRWLLGGLSTLCLLALLPNLLFFFSNLYCHFLLSPNLGVIGGADGPTVIITQSEPLPDILTIGVPSVILVACIVLLIRVTLLMRRMK